MSARANAMIPTSLTYQSRWSDTRTVGSGEIGRSGGQSRLWEAGGRLVGRASGALQPARNSQGTTNPNTLP